MSTVDDRDAAITLLVQDGYEEEVATEHVDRQTLLGVQAEYQVAAMRLKHAIEDAIVPTASGLTRAIFSLMFTLGYCRTTRGWM